MVRGRTRARAHEGGIAPTNRSLSAVVAWARSTSPLSAGQGCGEALRPALTGPRTHSFRAEARAPVPQPPEHRHHLQSREFDGRGPGMSSSRSVARHTDGLSSPMESIGRIVPSSLRRWAGGTSAACASGHQAGERAAPRRWLREAAGLWLAILPLAHTSRAETVGDKGADVIWHPPLHVSGQGARRAGTASDVFSLGVMRTSGHRQRTI